MGIPGSQDHDAREREMPLIKLIELCSPESLEIGGVLLRTGVLYS